MDLTISGRLRRTAPILAAACLAVASAADAHPHEAAPTADAVAADLMGALGGQEAWDATHFLRFTFAGRRTHYWDKWSGRHRVEGQTKEGEPFVVLENIDTKEGTAYLNGQPATGDKLKELLETGYGTWVNDTYWLLMPYKLKDPGVNLSYVGNEVIDGKTYDKLLLSFAGVGLTPGDRYWAYVDRGTHLMDRWAYVLQDQPPGSEPTAWLWQGWQRYGKIMLAPTRAQVGGDRKLELSNLAVYDSLPDSVFTSPEPVRQP